MCLRPLMQVMNVCGKWHAKTTLQTRPEARRNTTAKLTSNSEH